MTLAVISVIRNCDDYNYLLMTISYKVRFVRDYGVNRQ
jgi:hypothetical protein